MTYTNHLSKYRVSDGWEAHLKRGSSGGIDYAVPVGTPIPAPAAGTITNTPNNGSGGNTVTIKHGNGMRSQFLHLSKFVPAGSYKQGDIIGYSGGAKGAPGSGSSTGPHIHFHLILANGTRVNPLNYIGQDFDKQPAIAGWTGIQRFLVKSYGYKGAIDGIPGVLTWKALQTLLAKSYGYKGTVDGIPGPLTWKATQSWLREYGYKGAIDGIPGPMTFAALDRAGIILATR